MFYLEPMACLRYESAWKPLLLGLLFSEGKPSLPCFEVPLQPLEYWNEKNTKQDKKSGCEQRWVLGSQYNKYNGENR